MGARPDDQQEVLPVLPAIITRSQGGIAAGEVVGGVMREGEDEVGHGDGQDCERHPSLSLPPRSPPRVLVAAGRWVHVLASAVAAAEVVVVVVAPQGPDCGGVEDCQAQERDVGDEDG